MPQTSLPGDNSHLSNFDRADMIEQYGGVVDAQIAKRSIMRQFVDMHSIRGTDTKTVRRMGDTTLKGINDAGAGQEIGATSRNFDRAQVSVDTIILARDARALLNEFQTDFSARREIGMDHGKQIAKFFDAALLSMGVKTALSKVAAGVADAQIKGNQGRNLGDAFKSGYATELATAGDELDPDALYTAFEKVIVDMQENDVDTDETALFVRPRQHAVLLNNDKLVDRDFSRENGDFADGTVKTLMGVPIVSTARLADTNIDLSILSDGAEYVPTGIETKAVGLVMHPNSVLGGETIPLTSNVHYNDLRLSWYIDSYLAFGAAARRPDQTGAVFSFDATNDV
ncbi:major head protein [Paracoccus phage ParKuw1]|uniref:Major head protein n=1 Tax=Paracoccus phage ParKuw1 TaxID=3032415 RepID=A0AAF0FF58_9CAUD|nr:major head protein [Paracoccus phage ParKuw1]